MMLWMPTEGSRGGQQVVYFTSITTCLMYIQYRTLPIAYQCSAQAQPKFPRIRVALLFFVLVLLQISSIPFLSRTHLTHIIFYLLQQIIWLSWRTVGPLEADILLDHIRSPMPQSCPYQTNYSDCAHFSCVPDRLSTYT